MVFDTHIYKCGEVQLSRGDRSDKFGLTPENVNHPVLGRGNLPSNRLQLLSSEKGRKRENDIWNREFSGLHPRAADSVTP